MTINALTITITMWYNGNNRGNNGVGEENEKITMLQMRKAVPLLSWFL